LAGTAPTNKPDPAVYVKCPFIEFYILDSTTAKVVVGADRPSKGYRSGCLILHLYDQIF
jgi:hypothetical protein